MDMIETIKIMLDALENHTAIKHPQQIHYRDRAIEAGRQAVLKGHDMDKPEWQGLKPEEIEKLAKWADEHGHGPFHTDFAFAIDRLLRGKNLRRGEISQEPVAILNHAHGVHVFRNVKLNELPDGEYAVYTHPYTRQPKCAVLETHKPLTDEQDEFEKVFQMPANCTRFKGGYAPTSYNAWDAQTFCSRWEGWKARAAHGIK